MVLEVRSTAVCDDPEEFSSVNLAVRAGESCIAGFSQDRGEIDLLINIGVYRDRNIIEPAMSSLIQRELRLNNDPLATDMEKTTFSFDLGERPPLVYKRPGDHRFHDDHRGGQERHDRFQRRPSLPERAPGFPVPELRGGHDSVPELPPRGTYPVLP